MKYYYIGDDLVTTKPQDLMCGVRIFYEITDNIPLQFKDIDGPYNSLEQLRKESKIFKELAKVDSLRVQKILDEKNIISVALGKPKIFTLKTGYSKDYIKLFTHTYKGIIKSNNIFGIHFYDRARMKLKQMVLTEDKNKVWKAVVDVFDSERNEWFEKESTFFPKDWTLNQLFHECDFAYENRMLDENKSFIYKSITLSGVPVEIVVRAGEIKSIYPIYSKE